MNLKRAKEFILAQTEIQRPPLVREIALRLASEITPIWQASEAALERMNLPPPYWAFAWPGSQAIARCILDRADLVKGKSVLDFAAGAGLGAIAAARSGARHVVGADIDPVAIAAMKINAELNGVVFALEDCDLVGSRASWDVVLAGDVCYEKPMATRVAEWLRALAADGALVLLADPGRAYLPLKGLRELARYQVPTSLELEDRTMRETVVWQVIGST
jgi:predicted nicotinamide N-methyase